MHNHTSAQMDTESLTHMHAPHNTHLPTLTCALIHAHQTQDVNHDVWLQANLAESGLKCDIVNSCPGNTRTPHVVNHKIDLGIDWKEGLSTFVLGSIVL